MDLAPRVPHTTLVSIGDREADLFELFALARDPARPRLLVRANRGRQRQVLTAEGLTPLWDHLGGLEVAGRLALALPRRGAQAARTAELELRCGPVTLKPPQALTEAPLTLWAVSLHEAAPPAGAEGVDWLLLTNVATTTLAEAQERVRWYGARWGIEICQSWCLHKSLRQGRRRDRRSRRGHAAPSGGVHCAGHAGVRPRRRRPESTIGGDRPARPGGPAACLCAAS